MYSKFGGDWYSYSYPTNYFVDFTFTKYYNVISGDSMNYWVDYIYDFREAIWMDVVFDHNHTQCIQMNLEDFRVFVL